VERCKLPSGVWAKPQPLTILVYFQGEGTLLVAFKCTVSNNRKRLFVTFLWRNFPRANYCFHSVTLLWGSKPQRTLTTNLLWGFGVRTCGPLRDRRHVHKTSQQLFCFVHASYFHRQLLFNETFSSTLLQHFNKTLSLLKYLNTYLLKALLLTARS